MTTQLVHETNTSTRCVYYSLAARTTRAPKGLCREHTPRRDQPDIRRRLSSRFGSHAARVGVADA